MSNLTGQQLGNYRLVRHLGTGGCGEVYLGTHIHLQREAAIKILLKLDRQEIEDFRNEAQIIARLVHPHIITVFDYDVVGETPFIVMMYAQQGTMRTRYRPGTRVPLAEVVKYITQAANGLQFAHDQRIIHRDIKPANMLIGLGEQLLLSDFGLAIMWSGTHSIRTQQVIGTHGYMAPEQFQGRARPASDQYALAITAYEWVSGSRPSADSLMGLGMLQMAWPETEIPSLRRMDPHLPARLDDVFQRALSADWQVRFPSVREFAEELTRAAHSNGSIIYDLRSSGSVETVLPPVSTPPVPVRPGGWSAEIQVSAEALPTFPDTQPARTRLSPTQQAQYGNSSAHPLAPPPPLVSYPFAPDDTLLTPPPPPPPIAVQNGSRKAQQPLFLPVTRAKNARTTRTWTLGYAVFLLLLGAVPVALVAIYKGTASSPAWVKGTASVPAWVIVLLVIDIILLLLSATVLCGALLGKWRALPISIFAIGLPVLCAYLVNPGIFTSSSDASTGTDWIGYLLYAVLPLSAFLVGWIYERRRYARFGASLLSMLVGIAVMIIPPLILTSALSSSGALTGSALAGYLFTSWCLIVLVILPLALVAAAFEALLHTIVKRKTHIAPQGES